MAPTLLRLPRAYLCRRDAVDRLVAKETLERKDRSHLRSAFAFRCDELAFARALLARRTNLWLFRSSQRAFAGDFFVVDVSSPRPASRRAFALELKRGQPLRIGAPSALQLRNASQASRELAASGVIGEACAPTALTGDAREVLAYFADDRSISS